MGMMRVDVFLRFSCEGLWMAFPIDVRAVFYRFVVLGRVTNVFPISQVLRGVDRKPRKQMEGGVDEEVCPMDEDKRRIRRETGNNRINSVVSHFCGVSLH
jgi:hypothetical protein